MENGGYLVSAFTIAWAAVVAYVLFLAARQAKLRREIEALKQGLKERPVK